MADLVQTLGPQAKEVPQHVRVLHVRLRIALLRVDEGRELQEGGGKKTSSSQHPLHKNYTKALFC